MRNALMRCLVFSTALSLGCGGDDGGPQVTTPRLDITAGGNLADTISATNTQGLVVMVYGAEGRPAAGTVVNFESEARPCRSNPGASCSPVNFAPVEASGTAFLPAISDTTNFEGIAVVRTRMGTLSGTGKINITVPQYGLSGTTTYTINPGAAVGTSAAPRDTVVQLGTEYQLRDAAVVDRAGNPRAGTITYQAASSNITVTTAGRVTPISAGKSYVRVLSDGLRTDSVSVFGVPNARVAVSNINGPILLSTLIAGAERVLIQGVVNAQDWSPNGDRLVYVDDRGNGEYALSITDTLGNATQLPVPLRSTWPQYSRDGAWIYFFTQNSAPPRIMRIRPDGSGLQDLMLGRFPSASPDGRIAASLANGIWVGDPVSGAGGIVPNTTSGIAVRWSPNGQWIAYRAGNSVIVIRPDGSGRTVVPTSSVGGLAWSPDSRFLLSGSGDNARMVLIDTRDYATATLPLRGVYPAWKPVP